MNSLMFANDFINNCGNAAADAKCVLKVEVFLLVKSFKQFREIMSKFTPDMMSNDTGR